MIATATTAADQMLPLAMLAANERGRVACVLGDSLQAHRLRELGFCPGVELCVLRTGSACIVALGDRRLCLRAGECTQVMVCPGTRA